LTRSTRSAQRVTFDKDGMMRIDEGSLGELVVYGTPEEWQRFAAGLDDLDRALKHDVLPAAANPTAGGVIVTLKEAITMMAVMENEELTRSLMTLILEGRMPKRRTERDETSGP
jgi:hypothetical protein